MQKYEPLEVIGKGSFGVVRKVRRIEDGKVLVWKQLNYGRMSEREKKQLVAEVNILRELRHPNIVRYYDRIVDKKEAVVYIVMEHCEHGDVGSLLKRCRKDNDFISEDVIWKVFCQTLLALHECHTRTQKVLHRDLKPANLFMDSQHNIKLGDFGLARVMGEDSEFAKTHVGTPYYMSPEQVKQSCYNEKSDIWSLGCLIYELAALKPPFEALNHLALAWKIQDGKFQRLPFRYSQHLMSVVSSMLNLNPVHRPDCKQLMANPFIDVRLRERQLKEKHAALKRREQRLRNLEEREKEGKENREQERGREWKEPMARQRTQSYSNASKTANKSVSMLKMR